ncbi:MAG: amidohydrolase family protein [Acidobacteriota bacterium]
MFLRKVMLRLAPAVFVISLFLVIAVRCTKGPVSVYGPLRSYMDTIKVVNTHEHQRWFAEHEGHPYNFFTVLTHSYLQADLVSAGAPELKPEIVNQGDLEALWKSYGPYLDFSRNTSYYSHFLAGFQFLYGFSAPSFTRENIQALSAQIAANYSHREAWYEKAFRQAGFEIMFVDQYWNSFNTDLDSRYFALVFNINPLVYSISNRERLTAKDAPAETNIYRLAEEEEKAIKTLDDYLAAADRLMQKFKEHNVVCLKNSLAYSRSLDFDYVSSDDAKALFAKPPGSLSGAEKKALEDYMFHWIIEKSIALGLPIQIHTGYLAGNGNVLENSQPTKLSNLFLKYPQAKFVLFHGGYPWTGEYAALGKMFPNVYLDLVWLPQISREAAVRGLDEMFDTVPYNKFFWGGDCHFIEESAGSLIFGKDVVAQVLALRVERGLMTENLAREVALQIFRRNAIRFFKLELAP